MITLFESGMGRKQHESIRQEFVAGRDDRLPLRGRDG
jgi:hypothetical protein